jgi:hypothetical protein
MTLDTFVCISRPPFAWREFLTQNWFVARVSLLPTIMLAVPFQVLQIFTFDILLIEFRRGRLLGHGRGVGLRDSDRPAGDGAGGRGGRRYGLACGTSRSSSPMMAYRRRASMTRHARGLGFR